MKNLVKKAVLVLVVVFGLITCTSCTDSAEQLEELQNEELQLVEKDDDGTIDNGEIEEE